MIQIEFKKEDPKKLYTNFLHADHPKIRLKNLVLYLKSMGFSHSEICKLSRITEPTLASYLKSFLCEGYKSLEQMNWKGQESKLNDYKDIINAEFESTPPKLISEARDRIEKLTGISRSPTQIQYFLKTKLNYRYLKVGSLPGNGKDDDDKKENERETFKKNNSNHCWIRQGKERK